MPLPSCPTRKLEPWSRSFTHRDQQQLQAASVLGEPQVTWDLQGAQGSKGRGRREGCAGSGLRNLPGQPDSGSKLFLSVFSYQANVTKSVHVFIEEEDTTGVCELAVSEPVTRKPGTPAPWKAGRPADKRALADAGQGSAVRSRTVGCFERKARPDPTTVKSQCGAQQVTETSSDQGRTSRDPGWRLPAHTLVWLSHAPR